jgi:hypothetical protein
MVAAARTDRLGIARPCRFYALLEERIMSTEPQQAGLDKPTHAWLHNVHMAFVPGPMTALMEGVAEGILHQARIQGHHVQSTPDDQTDFVLTTAPFGEPINWRKSLLLSARRRFKLKRTPTVFTLTDVSISKFEQLLNHFETALAKEPPDPTDFEFAGLAPHAYEVLVEQGRRGGPILALERLVQAQTKCIRVVLVVGNSRPASAYHFDLVGAYPRSDAQDLPAFYRDILLRIVTAVCTDEVTRHQNVDSPIPHDVWKSLGTPTDMCSAAQELGRRNFFTQMVRIADLVHVPSVGDAVASQYSEGCFSTWDPTLSALVATVTGSARPVDKSDITEDDLAVIVGVRPDGQGALVREVAGKGNSPPSSEALEMIDMDRVLPRVFLDQASEPPVEVPVTRSKLHGHRSISAYHPDWVEFVPMQLQYYHYIVSCATAAQAVGIREAFAHSEALLNPDDPRQVAFTVLPGHGTMIVEKWVAGKAPFQVIWEYMDAGYLQVARRVPQGPMRYAPGSDGLMVVEAPGDMPEISESGGLVLLGPPHLDLM